MASSEDEVRAAMLLLAPKIAEFEARTEQAAAQYPADHPVLVSLRHHVALLQQEWDELRQHLKHLSS